MRKRIHFWLILLLGAMTFGQSVNTISGRVSDASGSPVPGAEVLLQDRSAITRNSARTDAGGNFAFTGVEPGGYQVVVSSPGFEATQTPITVSAGPIETLNVTLAVGTVSTSVVVTATRSAEEADQQPASTSVVTTQDIQNRNVQMLDEALDLEPGLFDQRGKGAADTLASTFLRGFNGPNRTLVMLDGQPINDPFSGGVTWTSLPIDEVQSVEIVRGPFSSLYGGNAMGGVINVLTRPVSHRELDLYGEYGSYDTTRYSARYADRFWSKLSITLGYQRLQFGGYDSAPVEAYPSEGTGAVVTGAIPTLDAYGNQVFIVGNSGRNWANEHSYYVKGNYSFSGATVLNVEYIRQDYGYGYNMYNSYLKTASGATVDAGTYLANYAGTLQPLSILPSSFIQDDGNQHSHFITASLMHKFKADRILRFDGSYYDTPNNNYRTPDYLSNASGGTGTYTNTLARSFHGNAQYNQTFGRQTIVVGSEARQDYASNPSYALSNWTLPDTLGAQTSAAIGRSINEAVYVQDEIGLTEHLHLVAGGRYEYWSTYDGQTNGFSSDAPLTNYPNRSVNSFTGKIGGTYGLPKSWTMRASMGTAFRNPDIYELYSTFSFFGTTYGASPHLSPERDRSFEFGVHKRFGTRTEVDADFYQNNISDLIYREADLAVDPSGNYLVNVNAAKGRTRGVESSLRAQLLSWLTIRSSYTYTNAIITDNPAEPYSVGKRVPNIPVNMFGSQLLGQHKKWIASLTGRYAGATYSTDDNSDVIKGVPGAYDAFFLLNANLSYQLTKHIQLFATGENLLDRHYYIYYLAPGREVFGGAHLKF